MTRFLTFFAAAALMTQLCVAEVTISPIFGDSMVVQRDRPVHVWGWTKPNIDVHVEMAGYDADMKSDKTGRFDVKLDPLPAGGPHDLVIKADETKIFKDVLVGEVWICSGQSNMQWPVGNANDPDLETLTANYPNIRLISVPQVGVQEPQNSFDGKWEACTPTTAKNFSAVGYFFGRQLHQTLDVPIGLIDNAWGGSAAEAWVNREVLEEAGQYDELLEKWDTMAQTYDHEAAMENHRKRVANWEKNKKGNRPRPPRNQLTGNHRRLTLIIFGNKMTIIPSLQATQSVA